MNSRGLLSSKPIIFLKNQQRDWKITVVRTSLDKLSYQMVFPYLSIYIMALGATATQLGFVNSLGMIAAGMLGPFTGWFIDRTGPKKIYLFGIGFLALSYLTYALAQDWFVTTIAMVAYWVGLSVSLHSCSTVCGNCLPNQDRATGMMICETVAAGLLGMAGPVIGTSLVTFFGGVTKAGIRPVFFFSLAITAGTFILIWTQLSNRTWRSAHVSKPHLLRDLHEVLKDGHHLKRWLVIATVNQLPLAMIFPFSQVFAHEIKGAEQFVLGAMVTGSALASILFAVPLGRLADRVGRKKVLYFTIPAFWASNLVLVWSPGPAFLVAAGVLQGFFFISGPIGGAMERELVPPEQMGRWIGIARFVRMILNAFMAFFCGMIWDRIGPQYVFLSFVALDLLIRVPLLISMPETLSIKFGRLLPKAVNPT